ncbi:hypothetical protein GPECTOR_17g806 [Gonium pectorale]|uniref:Uncharacterized protein n=1 Tax=Gonium pectorale TaxID=33097 RepID=A0A150GLI2_GONPE|nr:hypothetical protein GPECTOR_17g806 [Gonium pectorale]|eukprot:KXZ50170.1 hypothetical protein GPECTOR_17g806 [Gonium pectorale]
MQVDTPSLGDIAYSDPRREWTPPQEHTKLWDATRTSLPGNPWSHNIMRLELRPTPETRHHRTRPTSGRPAAPGVPVRQPSPPTQPAPFAAARAVSPKKASPARVIIAEPSASQLSTVPLTELRGQHVPTTAPSPNAGISGLNVTGMGGFSLDGTATVTGSGAVSGSGAGGRSGAVSGSGASAARPTSGRSTATAPPPASTSSGAVAGAAGAASVSVSVSAPPEHVTVSLLGLGQHGGSAAGQAPSHSSQQSQQQLANVRAANSPSWPNCRAPPPATLPSPAAG